MQRILAAGAGAVAAATAAVTRVRAVSEAEPSLLDDKSLNQPAGVGQSLQAWQSVTAGGSVYVRTQRAGRGLPSDPRVPCVHCAVQIRTSQRLSSGAAP